MNRSRIALLLSLLCARVASAEEPTDEPAPAAAPSAPLPVERPAPPPFLPDPPPPDPSRDLSTKQRRDLYLDRYIGFEEPASFGQSFFGSSDIDASRPFLGKKHVPLRAARYYQAVGRDDLAQQYTSRLKKRWTTWAIGAALGTAGMAVLVAALEPPLNNVPGIGGVGAGAIAALSLNVVSLAFTTASSFFAPAPLPPDDARALAADYNRRLREHLGLDTDYTLPTAAISARPRWAVGATGLHLAF